MFITSNSLRNNWMVSPKNIFGNTTAVANTLAPYYKRNDSELWILYNDQPPNRSHRTSKGHTKGVVGASVIEGFWMIHSVPQFPPSSDKYSYAANGVTNGQIFLCISLSPKNLNNLGN
ncbi:hypothetical protein AAG570_011529 [Ranatra chinensis]|uniref:Plancitoxin-1 n=1 Tax=Ranatra chinensis TaxID=642074 RepID=A0ABD0Z747_9HEMI